MQELDCDFYVFTGHKVYGPTGIGVLYGKREWLERMPPYQGGGEMIDEVRCEGITYNEPPHRFEAGTPPIVEAIGLGAAVRFMMELGRERIQAHEAALSAYAHERLRGMNSLRIIGQAPRARARIIAFEMKGAHAHDVATVIDRQGVAVRAGTHCAMPLLDALRRHLDLPCVLRPLQHAWRKWISWPRRCGRRRRCSRDALERTRQPGRDPHGPDDGRPLYRPEAGRRGRGAREGGSRGGRYESMRRAVRHAAIAAMSLPRSARQLAWMAAVNLALTLSSRWRS